jgi:hypothetical protein
VVFSYYGGKVRIISKFDSLNTTTSSSDNHNDDVFDQHQNKTLKTRKDDEEKHIYRVLTP